MRCNAWNFPQGCYDYAAAEGAWGGCPSTLWFWVLAGLVGVYAIAK